MTVAMAVCEVDRESLYKVFTSPVNFTDSTTEMVNIMTITLNVNIC